MSVHTRTKVLHAGSWRGQQPVSVSPGYVEEVTEQIAGKDIPAGALDGIVFTSHSSRNEQMGSDLILATRIEADIFNVGEIIFGDLPGALAQDGDALALAFQRINAASVIWRHGSDSFPGMPSEGDQFYRSDLHAWYYWDGAQWNLDGSSGGGGGGGGGVGSVIEHLDPLTTTPEALINALIAHGYMEA